MKTSLLILTFLISLISLGQKKVEIIQSNSLDFDAQVADAQRLVGDVILQYGDVRLFCDSAYKFENDDFDAFGKVRIAQGDSLTLLGKSLKFTASDRIARMREDIVLSDKDIVLNTEFLDYNLDSKQAYYYNGGKMVSRLNQNVLTSQTGYYDAVSKNLHFRKEVELVNPEYTVWSDTLKYNPSTEKAFFFGPTTIHSAETVIYCENGWYDTRREICQFNRHARISSGSNILSGDSIYYDGERGFGEVFRNVSISDTTSNYRITGNYGWHERDSERSFVTGEALMTQAMDKDSLFLHADTLRAAPETPDFKRITAYRSARFFKSDLQGKADSLVYLQSDSTIYFYKEPVLWSDENQLTGDSIRIKTFEGKIDKLVLNGNAFIVSEVAPDKFNQIKGRNMNGVFRENKLRTVYVNGNGQTIYYPTEVLEDKSVKVVGLNKVDCSDIRISILDNKIEKIAFINLPSGKLVPNSMVVPEDLRLEGFGWYSNLRPGSVDDLFKD